MQARASGIELCRVLAMLTLFPVPARFLFSGST